LTSTLLAKAIRKTGWVGGGMLLVRDSTATASSTTVRDVRCGQAHGDEKNGHPQARLRGAGQEDSNHEARSGGDAHFRE